jgi:hypothetical protein
MSQPHPDSVTTPVLATYGHCSGSCDARANKALGIGSGWQQSRQNQAPRAVVVYYLSEMWLRPPGERMAHNSISYILLQGCTCKADRNGHERACIRAKALTVANVVQAVAAPFAQAWAVPRLSTSNRQTLQSAICKCLHPVPEWGGLHLLAASWCMDLSATLHCSPPLSQRPLRAQEDHLQREPHAFEGGDLCEREAAADSQV